MDFSLYRNLGIGRYEHEMVLVGGPNPRREQFVSRLLDLPLEIYGKWGKRSRKALTLPTIRDRMGAVIERVEAL